MPIRNLPSFKPAAWTAVILMSLVIIGISFLNVEAEAICDGAVGTGSGSITSIRTSNSGADLNFSNNASDQDYYFGWNAYDQYGNLIYEGNSGWVSGSGVIGGSYVANVPTGYAFANIDVEMFEYINGKVVDTGSGSAGCAIADLTLPRNVVEPLRAQA